MKKERMVKYKRKEAYRKKGIFFRFREKKEKEIHGEKCIEKHLMNKALIL